MHDAPASGGSAVESPEPTSLVAGVTRLAATKPGGNILESAVAPSVYAFALQLSVLGIPNTSDF